jgi:hypothetical protein
MVNIPINSDDNDNMKGRNWTRRREMEILSS